MLHDGPSYGYGVLKRISAQSKYTLRWHQGTLYPVLHRLERRGLIVGEWRRPKTGRERRYYRLTPTGQRVRREQREEWRHLSRAVNALLGL